MPKSIASASVIAVAALAAAGAFDIVAEAWWRAQIVADSHGDPRVIARMLLNTAPPVAGVCANAGDAPPTDYDRLMAAISVAESFAHSRVDKLAEDTVVRLAVLVGAPVPDLSIGAGEIRISTAQRALLASREPEWAAAQGELALWLLEPCRNHRIGVRVLKWIAGQQGLAGRPLDHATIVALAAAYNGQAIARDPAHLLANATYNEVVYTLYYDLAFRELAAGQPPNKSGGSASAAGTR